MSQASKQTSAVSPLQTVFFVWTIPIDLGRIISNVSLQE